MLEKFDVRQSLDLRQTLTKKKYDLLGGRTHLTQELIENMLLLSYITNNRIIDFG